MPTIRELREAKGWNQTELASRASISLQTVSNTERGLPVQRSTLFLIAQALGVKPEEVSGVNVVNWVSRRAGRAS